VSETIVVTGASRGIGRATALAFAARGFDVALLARSAGDLAQVATACSALGVRAHVHPCDVADPESVQSACNRVLSEGGAPRAVVNNAGVVHRAPLVSTSVEQWRHVVSVNLDATFYVTRCFLESMLAVRRGRIINVASISATFGTAKHVSYCASKWGVVGFTKALAEELRETGLQTLSVLPGSTDTQMLEGSGFPPQMQPEEVAAVIAYAALDAPAAMNGASLDVFGP
jgi:3-oxoacyl-[acyl-carrier protein] reductase